MPEYTEIYARYGDQYDQLVSREDHAQRILPALSEIRDLAGLDVVELGAGTGRLSAMVAPVVCTLTMLDASWHMLAVAMSKLADTGKANWQMAVADHRALPLRDASADLVLGGWTVCYLVVENPDSWRKDVELVLAEARRVLRHGGTIALLETLGTGYEVPQWRGPLAEYYAFLEARGFASKWIRTDYQFDSLSEAERLTRFFFGESLAEQVVKQRWSILPECTGLWWLHV